jgi:putative radical SAM enzyme (TIGR03279 family)
MTFFTEIDWTARSGGKIIAIEPDSVAADIELLPGDELLAVNDNQVQDVIDVQYYAAEEYLELLIRRGEEFLLYEAERAYQQPLGLAFEHPTFDTDIRRCNNLCEFCFVLQMAPRFRRTLYIKDDDYRYSFLFGHYVTLTNLSDHDWWRIENMGLSPLYVSVHVTDLEMRRQFLRNASAPDILPQLRRLADHGVEVHTQLVVVPEFNDGPWLERSISELADLWPAVRSISVVPVGLTSHHKYKMRPHTPEEAAATLAYVESLQPIYQQRFGRRFVYPTDEWYLVTDRQVPPLEAYDGQQLHENGLGMVRRFLDDWENVKQEITSWEEAKRPQPGRQVTLVTGTLFGPTLEKAAAEFAALTGVKVNVHQIINQRLGDTITAAGLLMAEDVLAQLKAAGYGDLVVLPRVIFDHPDVISLDDMTPQQAADALGRPVALADLMGDIWDALIGESAVLFRPGNEG